MSLTTDKGIQEGYAGNMIWNEQFISGYNNFLITRGLKLSNTTNNYSSSYITNPSSGDVISGFTPNLSLAPITVNQIINQTTGNPLEPTSFQRAFQAVVFGFTTDVATGDGKFYIHIDPRVAGMSLIDVHAKVITAGTTNTTQIQIANVTTGNDMLSTKLSVDSGETDSSTAASPAVINTAYKSVSLNDILRIDVDAVSTTAPKGLLVTLGFSS